MAGYAEVTRVGWQAGATRANDNAATEVSVLGVW